MSYCVQIDDQRKEVVCTSDASARQMYERIGLSVVPSASCRPGYDSTDCPSGHTCQQRFAHTSIPNALPTHCIPKR